MVWPSPLLIFLNPRYTARDPSLRSETFHYERGSSQTFYQPAFTFDPSIFEEDEVESIKCARGSLCKVWSEVNVQLMPQHYSVLQVKKKKIFLEDQHSEDGKVVFKLAAFQPKKLDSLEKWRSAFHSHRATH